MTDDPLERQARTGVALDEGTVRALQTALPRMAGTTVDAVTAQVPEYARAGTEMDTTILQAVELALGAFLRRATGAGASSVGAPSASVLEAAYALGRGEAASGRTLVALLSAYRAGASAAWQEMSDLMVGRGTDAGTVAQFAALVFTYIDELSASSAAGHADQLATTGRVREQYLERLGRALLLGAEPAELSSRAARADWDPPVTLTAVLLPPAHLRRVVARVHPRSLIVSGDVAELLDPDDTSVLLIPDVQDDRGELRESLRGTGAAIGPTRAWTEAASSFRRASVLRELVAAPKGAPLDADQHLVAVVLAADPEALADLRAHALAPLSGLRDGTAEKLEATLRSWLLHQGRRGAVAEDLHVHAQTVRYRMDQVRDLFGDRLTDPESVLELTIALAATSPPHDSGAVG